MVGTSGLGRPPFVFMQEHTKNRALFSMNGRSREWAKPWKFRQLHGLFSTSFSFFAAFSLFFHFSIFPCQDPFFPFFPSFPSLPALPFIPNFPCL